MMHAQQHDECKMHRGNVTLSRVFAFHLSLIYFSMRLDSSRLERRIRKIFSP